MVMAEGTAVLRRNRPGTKAQYIQQNIRADCSNIDKILEPPEGQDEGVWKYEHLRQFCLELNGLAVKLQNETFLCHRFTKFVMKYNLMSKDNLIVPILEEEVQNSVSGESEA
ncbi:hypothetical protein JD844_023122 [Phrynosoma platyrhinos]|uniref:MOB kinase activator 1A n=1 Tax=Phrynosoma platyrhinos TaxID=52577 RepID=A0ABQ7SVZ6_PHRPL|nr:hypothetical protein JD844_023122 [Phrynosoma platyrhinos]